MGGKTTTSTNTVKIPQEVLDRYNAVNTQAQGVAENPFQRYGTQASDFVAQFTPQQTQGVEGINAVAGMGPAYGNVEKYLNPYTKNVADTTRAQMEQANEQAQSGALGVAAQSGAFGGDRAGVAAANLAQQQGMAMGSTMANIYNQGYGQAMDTSMNDMNRMLGVAGQQLSAGTMQQQTEQAGKDALINQFQQEQGYPFQVAQFLANIAMGTGALSGSTTTSVQPGSFFSDRRLKHDIKEIGKSHNGLPIYTFKYKGDPESNTHVGFMADEVEQKTPEAVGLDPSGYKTVDYDKATQSMGGGVHARHSGEAFADGGVAGPYGSKVGQQVGLGSYVPQAYLPIADLMMADPNASAQKAATALDVLDSASTAGKSFVDLRDTFGKNGTMWDRKAYGGGISGGYAEGGMVQPQRHGDYLSSTLAAQEARKDKPELKTAGQSEQRPSGFSQLASGLGSIASIFSLSDRRTKHDIKEIGKSHNGLPIYTFKYKGDDREQTHVGFMADEVERKHPDAVGKRDGYKTVDYSQAHKFADGGVAGGRNGYAEGGVGKAFVDFVDNKVYPNMGNAFRSVLPAAAPLMRNEIPAAQNLGDLPEAEVVAAEVPENSKTIPERLADIKLNERLPAVANYGLNLLAAPVAAIAGAGAGLAGAPETGNYLMDFSKKRFEDAGDAATHAFGTDAQTREMHLRNAVENRPLLTLEDESRRAYRAAAANRFNATNGVVPDGYVGPNSRSEAADRYLGLDNKTDGQLSDVLLSQGLTEPGDNYLPPRPTGVVPVGAPADGQTRPMPRPEGLGSAGAPTVDQKPMRRPQGLGAAAPVIVGTTMTPTGDGSKFDLDRLAAATRFQESGSPSGNYGAIGQPVARGDGFDYAYGAYGIMGANIPSWTEQFLGKSMTPEEFLRDPQSQDTVAKGKLAEYYDKYGNVEDVASTWFSGRPLEGNNSIDATSGKSVPSYVSDVVAKYYGGGEGTPANYDIGTSPSGVAGVAGGDRPRAAGAPRGGVKPYEERNALGQAMYNEDGRLNKDATLSLLAGLGNMLSSPSPFLLPAIGAGISGAANTYMAREGQVAEINAKNIENMGKLYDMYNKFMFTNPEYAGTSLEDFARQNGLSHMLPKDASSALPVTGITLQDTKGYVDAGNGIQIPFMSDYASLTRLANEWKNAPEGTMQRRAADAAELKLAEINETGYTTGIDQNGQTVPVPVNSVIAQRGAVATDARNVENTQEFRARANAELPMIAPQMDSVDRQIGIYSKTESGLLAQPTGQIAALASAFGIDIAGFNDLQQAALVQEALKDKARGIVERGGSGAETDFARSFIEAGAAGPSLEPDAVKKLLAIEKASLERERDRLTLHQQWQETAENPYDLNAYEAFFAENYPLSGYTERVLQGMPKFVGETGSEQKPYPIGYPLSKIRVGDFFLLSDGTVNERTE